MEQDISLQTFIEAESETRLAHAMRRKQYQGEMTGKSQKRLWLLFLWLVLLTIINAADASTFVLPITSHPSTLKALNCTTVQGYTARGLLGTITEPSGQVTTLGYDGRRRLTSRTDPVGTVNYGLDDASQLLTVTQGTSVLARTYHDSGEVETYTNANNETISYDYDKNGNLVTLKYPTIGNVPAVTVTYTYDNRDRLTSITDWMGRVTSYTWDDAGRLTQVTRPNATKRTLKWDAAGQLLGIEERPGSGAPLAVRSFQYDAVGRLTKRLSYPQSVAWSESAWNAIYNDDNRLTTLAGVALNYDTDGNLLGSRLPDGPWGAGGTSTNANGTFTWNARNQLTQVIRSGSNQTINYTYDAEGHLIQSTDSVAGTTRWIIDPNGGDCSRILSKVAPNGEVTRYVYGVGLVYEVRQNGGVRYYHYDQIGNTIALTDHNGTVTGTADYTPYGNLQSASGELANANVTPFLFVGAFGVMTDSATGLHQMRARWYSSHLRRFLSEDPAGFAGGENFYAYASGNPITLIDPLGLCETSGFASLLQGTANAIGSFYDKAFYYPKLNNETKMAQVYREHPNIKPIGDLSSFDYAITGLALIAPEIAAARVSTVTKGLTTPSKYFGRKTATDVSEAMMSRFGSAKSIREGAQTFYNPKTGRSFNVHTDPAHGRPHVDIRRRGGYPERKYPLTGE